MTSANVIFYSIRKGDEEVHLHRQNLLCKQNLTKFLDFDGKTHTVVVYGEDENEVRWENPAVSLNEFLRNKRIIF